MSVLAVVSEFKHDVALKETLQTWKKKDRYLKCSETKSVLAKAAEQSTVKFWSMWGLEEENIKGCSIDSWW